MERTTKQIATQLAISARNPDSVAGKAWNKLAFGDHPYGRPSDGTPETMAAIRREDLVTLHRRILTREHLKIVAVGDIDPKALGDLLDKLFADLPAKSELAVVPAITLRGGGALQVIEMPVPQSVARFGMAALMRKDPDFMAATVVNQILGGGGFASRLMEEVREKRGLAYSVYSYMAPYTRSGTFGGGVATKNSILLVEYVIMARRDLGLARLALSHRGRRLFAPAAAFADESGSRSVASKFYVTAGVVFPRLGT